MIDCTSEMMASNEIKEIVGKFFTNSTERVFFSINGNRSRGLRYYSSSLITRVHKARAFNNNNNFLYHIPLSFDDSTREVASSCRLLHLGRSWSVFYSNHELFILRTGFELGLYFRPFSNRNWCDYCELLSSRLI